MDVVRLVKGREASAREVLTSVLERVDQVEPEVNAIAVQHRDLAYQMAGRVDQEIARGADPGILAGVPATIKLTGDIRHTPSHQLLPGVPSSASASADSPSVGGLRHAGAIFIGQTNVPEYNMRWDTDNPVYGRTFNPWVRDVVAGGSSGGAVVAVATGMGALAHGSDLGGSIRQPADCCGVVTIRPTVGRTPTLPSDRRAAIDSQLMGVDGPIGRSVEDVWLGLRAMSNGFAHEPLVPPVKLEWAPPKRFRVRVVENLPGVAVHSAVASALRFAADALADAGHQVESAGPLPLRRMAEDRNALVYTTIARTMKDAFLMTSPDLNQIWANMVKVSPPQGLDEYIALLARRAEDMRAWDELMGEADVYLGPVSACPAFKIGSDSGSVEIFSDLVDQLQLLIALVVTALPVAVVPAGATADGIPIGVQIVGPRWREDYCLAAAQVVERARGIRTPIRPMWAGLGSGD